MLLRLTSTCDWFLVVVQHPEKSHLQLSASPQSFYSLLTVASSAILHEVDQIFFFPSVIKKYSFTVGQTSPGRRKICRNSTRGAFWSHRQIRKKMHSHYLLYLSRYAWFNTSCVLGWFSKSHTHMIRVIESVCPLLISRREVAKSLAANPGRLNTL